MGTTLPLPVHYRNIRLKIKIKVLTCTLSTIQCAYEEVQETVKANQELNKKDLRLVLKKYKK